MSPRKRKKLFTTGEIASMIDTNSKIVARWIDEGLLKGVEIPGMKERRVHHEALRAFLLKFEYTWAIEELDQLCHPDGEGAAAAGEARPAKAVEEKAAAAAKAPGSLAGGGRRRKVV